MVLGNCGVTFAPVRAGQESWLAALMESVEDIPAASILAGLAWDWETYGDYLATIDALPRIGAFGGAAWAVEAFHDQFTSRGRCPADDLLDAWASTGALFPNDQPLEPAWT